MAKGYYHSPNGQRKTEKKIANFKQTLSIYRQTKVYKRLYVLKNPGKDAFTCIETAREPQMHIASTRK